MDFCAEIVHFIGKAIIIGESKPDQQMTGEEFSPVIESEFTLQNPDDKNVKNGKRSAEDLLFFFFCFCFCKQVNKLFIAAVLLNLLRFTEAFRVSDFFVNKAKH